MMFAPLSINHLAASPAAAVEGFSSQMRKIKRITERRRA
jgi:hypothetical protein